MTRDTPVNLPASIHQRLLNRDPHRIHDFTPVLRRYAFERWLYRLGQSKHAGQFAVKGAMLLVLWTGDLARKTMDLDLWSAGGLTEGSLREAFTEIGEVAVKPDGMIFPMDSLIIEKVRDEAEFDGLRAKFSANLGTIRIPLQIDVGIGDSVWPEPEFILYPTLLDMPAPRVQAYRKETTIAEKFDAILERGETNSRMKDFYDIAILGGRFSFQGKDLQKALRTTISNRTLATLPDLPIAFTDDFARIADKNIQWSAFLRRIGKNPMDLPFQQAVEKIKVFLLPVLQSLKAGTEFRAVWPAGGPWRSQEKDHDG